MLIKLSQDNIEERSPLVQVLDTEFPHSPKTIADNDSHKFYQVFEEAAWLRPHQIFQTSYSHLQLCSPEPASNDHARDADTPSSWPLLQGLPGLSDVLQSHLNMSPNLPLYYFLTANQRHLVTQVFRQQAISEEGTYRVSLYLDGK